VSRLAPRRLSRRQFLTGAAAGAIGALVPAPAAVRAGVVEFVFVPHAPVTALDPVWTPAHATRNHAYMIYDTLFGVDEQGQIRPQMLDRYGRSSSGLQWSFTLREGLRWHDGHAVTAEDCVASLSRWSRNDPFGQLLASHTRRLVPIDKTTFVLDLGEPFPFVLEAMARPGRVPFMMPARIAATPASEQIKEHVGSGPFRFAEFVPGAVTIYTHHVDYRPRQETPSGSAGGKHARLKRVVWRFHFSSDVLREQFARGHVDWWESPPLNLLSEIERDSDTATTVLDPVGIQGWLLPNHLHPPFNRKEARQALVRMMDQRRYLTAIAPPSMQRPCGSIFPCGSRWHSHSAMEALVRPDPARARQLMAAARYDGRPIVLLDPVDVGPLHAAAGVTGELLNAIGVTVDLQAAPWSEVLRRRARKDPPHLGGWHLLVTSWSGLDIADPAVHAGLGGVGKRSWIGWAASPELDRLRMAWLRTPEPNERRRLVDEIERLALEEAMYVPFGQWISPTAYRRTVAGILRFPIPLLWNVSDTAR